MVANQAAVATGFCTTKTLYMAIHLCNFLPDFQPITWWCSWAANIKDSNAQLCHQSLWQETKADCADVGKGIHGGRRNTASRNSKMQGQTQHLDPNDQQDSTEWTQPTQKGNVHVCGPRLLTQQQWSLCGIIVQWWHSLWWQLWQSRCWYWSWW